MTIRFPEDRRFAFTIMDDTDVSTVENVKPMYELLEQLGFRTTKTVWPLACPEGSRNFGTSETLEDDAYLQFVLGLRDRGFEIAYHGATMESSIRERTVRGLARFQHLFGRPPRVYANHAYNREGLYWGVDRLDDPFLRQLYGLLDGRPRDYYQGHVPGSSWWWGDLASGITYARNLAFTDVNLLRTNPSLPYRDPRRPLVPWWFSASNANDVRAFNKLLSRPALDALERDSGVCIVATHLGKGFVSHGGVDGTTERLLRDLSQRPGYFVPVGDLLDWLRTQQGEERVLPAGEWRNMQWRWARQQVEGLLRRRLRR